MKYLNRNTIIAAVFTLLVFSCSSDECPYIQEEIVPEVDCPDLGLDIGDACDAGNGVEGIVNEFCECVGQP